MITQPSADRPPQIQRHPTLMVQPELLSRLSGRPDATRNASAGAPARTGPPNRCFARLDRSIFGGVLDTDNNRNIVQTNLLGAVSRCDPARLERLLNEISGTTLCANVIDCILPADCRVAEPGDSLLHVLAGRRVRNPEASQMTAMLLKHGANPTLFNFARETAPSRAVTHRQYNQLIALIASPLANLGLRTPRAGSAGFRRWETLHNQIERLGDTRAAEILNSSARNEVDREGPIDLPSSQEWEQPELLVPVPLEHEAAVLAVTEPLKIRFDREGLPTYREAQAQAQARPVAAASRAVNEPPPIYSERPARFA